MFGIFFKKQKENNGRVETFQDLLEQYPKADFFVMNVETNLPTRYCKKNPEKWEVVYYKVIRGKDIMPGRSNYIGVDVVVKKKK